MRPKTGTRVRERRFWNLLDPDVMAWRLEDTSDARLLRDVIDLRRVIEPEAARLAAQRAGDDEIADLRAAFEAMCAAGNDADAYLGPDLRFHAIILDACHNELLGQMATTLRRVLRVVFVMARNEAGLRAGNPAPRGDPGGDRGSQPRRRRGGDADADRRHRGRPRPRPRPTTPADGDGGSSPGTPSPRPYDPVHGQAAPQRRSYAGDPGVCAGRGRGCSTTAARSSSSTPRPSACSGCAATA